jgi:GAF domain-containing protein
VRLLQTLATSMSVALENARLFAETQRRTRETAALVEVGRDISSTLDLRTAMDRIARHAKDLTSADTSAIFLPDASGQRPCHGDDPRFRDDPAWKDLLLFYEYFHGDTGRGVGASHQTGWTALAVRGIEYLARREAQDAEARAARGKHAPPALERVAKSG